MATNKEQYNIDQLKKNATTGQTYNPADYGAKDLSAYGIDYSQAQRDAIANIFKDSATAAYGTAQNQYSNTMAQQQASLQDTMRRSQAQAVATGASKGMQAANELSAMLGLQQTAAQEASAVQGSYAEALANAQQQAYDIQNAANQIGASMYAADTTAGAEKYSADVASDAQKYAANIDAQINDPYRIFSELDAAKTSGDNIKYDALLNAYLSSSGVSEGSVKEFMSNIPNITREQEQIAQNKDKSYAFNQKLQQDLKEDKQAMLALINPSPTTALTMNSNAMSPDMVESLKLDPEADLGTVTFSNTHIYFKTTTGWRQFKNADQNTFILSVQLTRAQQGLDINPLNANKIYERITTSNKN